MKNKSQKIIKITMLLVELIKTIAQIIEMENIYMEDKLRNLEEK